MTERLTNLVKYLESLERAGYYGVITLRFRDGQVETLTVERSYVSRGNFLELADGNDLAPLAAAVRGPVHVA